jgi:hypothetical protein
MEGREKLHMDKYREITNDWNYDTSCRLTSLLILDLENFKHLIFVAQSVQNQIVGKTVEAKENILDGIDKNVL